MRRRITRRVLFAVAVAGALLAPSRSEAQNVFLGNGFSIACVGLDCGQLRFVVNPYGGTVGLMSYMQLVNPQLFGQLGFLNASGLWYGSGFTNPMVVFLPNPSRWIPIIWGQGGGTPYVPPPEANKPPENPPGGDPENPPGGDPENPPGGDPGNTTDPDTTVTPEPATMLLLGTGLAGVLAAARRRKAKGRSA